IMTDKSLADEIIAQIPKDREIVLLRAEEGSPILSEKLIDAGYAVKDIPLYRLREETDERAARLLPIMDYLTFSSSSGVKFYHERYGEIPKRTKAVVIGEVTAKTFEDLFHTAYIRAPKISAEGIVEAILNNRNNEV
ncbi:MAG: uroporphyrinogen-III synthase, partial [Clostridia bacterium]|nr:uroporphyrinogen-III synthase [Clostridia bacterium]